MDSHILMGIGIIILCAGALGACITGIMLPINRMPIQYHRREIQTSQGNEMNMQYTGGGIVTGISTGDEVLGGGGALGPHGEIHFLTVLQD